MIVYRKKLGKVGGCAGDYSRGRRGCHYIAGRAKGARAGGFGKGKIVSIGNGVGMNND